MGRAGCSAGYCETIDSIALWVLPVALLLCIAGWVWWRRRTTRQ